MQVKYGQNNFKQHEGDFIMSFKFRFFAIILALLMVLSICGCDNNKGSTGTNDDKTNNSTNLSNADLEKLKGTTLKFATWKNPYTDEDGPVIKSFEEKYGIKVEIVTVNQGDYVNTISGLIASDNSPDIYFSNNDFPAALSCLQPIDAMNLNLDDSIWDKGTFDMSTVNGKTYLVNTVGNIWNEVDCVFYNKRLLEDNGITTPEEYYEAGKWTFAALEKVMTEVKNLGNTYTGGYVDFRTIIGSTGAGYYKFENGQFSNGMDSKLTDVNRILATWYKNGLVKDYGNNNNRDEFIDGKVGIAITNAYGLKKTGYWQKMNSDDIGFTYLPDYDEETKAVTTGLFRGWGLIKGSKNPEAAGLFLRYYLDVSNYDLDSAFISTSAKNFFFKLTSSGSAADKNMYFMSGAAPITNIYLSQFADISNSDPNQVAQQIATMKNVVDSGVNKLNDFVSKQTSNN